MYRTQYRVKFLIKRSSSRGQTALETFFVFGAIIFMSFTMLNFSVMMHTKTVASYAAFMSGRAYQVYGDQTGAEAFEELGGSTLLGDQKTTAVVRVAEDIFTCGLPWMRAPENDVTSGGGLTAGGGQFRDRIGGGQFQSCAEGEREYQSTNINKRLTVFRFDNNTSPSLAGAQGSLLESVAEGYHEEGREPLRFAILKVQYKNPLMFNILNVFDGPAEIVEDGRVQVVEANDAKRNARWHSVHVPLLLNPGVGSGAVVAEDTFGDPNIDEDAQ